MSTQRAGRRRFLLSSLFMTIPGSLVGCGTVLHPERRGQGSGKLDWRIVGLDAAGLLLFFVPGVIAFAVDFYQGTIFLPAGSAGLDHEHSSLVSVHVSREELTHQKIEQTVSQHVDRPVRLKPGSYRTSVLRHLDGFWTLRDRLMANSSEA